MDRRSVVVKTSKGVEGIETKKWKCELSSRARTVLILVARNKTAGELVDMALRLGSPASVLDEFVATGLVEMKT